ncbi:MAG TPA: tyrosinase family protein [Solirubrobacteraceae bacterium]|jgi:tyrosinase|nr:tyrosinase family protein [Solirubrobacteraceae bacterium]
MSVGTASPTSPAVALRHRLSVDLLGPDDLAGVREAFSASQAIADDRGYEHWAGIHGLPLPMYCTHGTPLFLPWHRAYLYSFELSLRDAVPDLPGFALPWWDWTSDASHANGVPEAYTDQTDASGGPNPLVSATVDPTAVSQASAQGIEIGATTVRQPDVPGNLPSADDLQGLLGLTDFQDFSSQIENIHNNVHGWVAGDMGEIPVAAFDPLFWAHHCMIDRIWRLWQLQNPGSTVPASLLGQALAPFSMTVAQTIDATSLGYDYASTSSVPVPPAPAPGSDQS